MAGEKSGENKGKIEDVPEPPKTHHKMPMFLNRIIIGTD
jgi:hypothetical protein